MKVERVVLNALAEKMPLCRRIVAPYAIGSKSSSEKTIHLRLKMGTRVIPNGVLMKAARPRAVGCEAARGRAGIHDAAFEWVLSNAW